MCCLLDEATGQPTSANIGELCISGPGVALGYVRRNSLTKEKFTQYGYRTGDLVTFDNGRIFFHERIDTQVKLRGFRIELDEIEQELLRISDDIQSAAVIVEKEQIIAFIVGQLTESRMREALGKRLPRYMVPDRLIKLNEAMPRLISGKIDRKALIAHVSKDDAKQTKASETIIKLSKFTETIFTILFSKPKNSTHYMDDKTALLEPSPSKKENLLLKIGFERVLICMRILFVTNNNEAKDRYFCMYFR